MATQEPAGKKQENITIHDNERPPEQTERVVRMQPEEVVFEYDGQDISPAHLTISNLTNDWIVFKVAVSQAGR